MGSESLHEPYEQLRPETRDLHRAIVSLMEELEAVDWYQQRADVTPNAELKAVLLHHRNEEIEHAIMNLEWIRRHDPVFDENCKTYLFSQGPITAVEEVATGKSGGDAGGEASGGGSASAGSDAPSVPAADGSLGIGSLKG